MSHLALVAPPFLGHLNPMVALAGALGAMGHRVTMFGMSDAAAAVERSGIAFAPLGRRSHPPGTLRAMTDRMASPGGLGLFRILRDMAGTMRMYSAELPAACRAHQVDGLVVDQLEPGGALAAAQLGLPFVSVANALPIRRDPLLPPPFVGWRYDATPWGLGRNRGGYRVADMLMHPVNKAIREEAARAGLPHGSLEDALSPLADITQLVQALDFPRARHLPHVHPCGPLRDGEDESDVAELLGDGRLLVFASLGTLQGGRAPVFRHIAGACARLDLHLVIAHGGRLPEAAIAGLPGRPTVRAFVPQRALLRRAVLAVTNGGLNTVLDALAAAVPLLVIPVAFEQEAIGARVAFAGVGRVLPRRRLSLHRLETTMRDLLLDTGVHDRAATMARLLAEAGGAARAASIVDAAVRTGRPVPDLQAAATPAVLTPA